MQSAGWSQYVFLLFEPGGVHAATRLHKALTVTVAFWSPVAQAQTYPSRPIVMVVPYRRGRHVRRHGPHSCGADERAPGPAGGRREHDRRRRHHRGEPRHQRRARRLYGAARVAPAPTPTTRRSTRSAATTPSTISPRSRCSPSSRWCSKCARIFPPTPCRSSLRC